MSRIFPDSDRTAGGPVLSTAIFLFLCILKALMSAENVPVFGMLVRLQVNQHGPVGGLGVALGLFWARRTNLRGRISLYRPLEHPSRPGCGPPIFLIVGSCTKTRHGIDTRDYDMKLLQLASAIITMPWPPSAVGSSSKCMLHISVGSA